MTRETCAALGAAVAVAFVTTLAVPARGSDGVRLPCAVVRDKGSLIESNYTVSVENTTARRLPAKTPVAVVLTLADGSHAKRSAELADALAPGGVEALFGERLAREPETACEASVAAEATPVPAASPASTPSPAPATGATGTPDPVANHHAPTPSPDAVAPRHVPTP